MPLAKGILVEFAFALQNLKNFLDSYLDPETGCSAGVHVVAPCNCARPTAAPLPPSQRQYYILKEVFGGFPQSLQENVAEIVS